MTYISIAIDGPAGAGKSTIAKEVAKILGIEYLDTGAMYRALTLKVLNLKIDPLDKEKVNSIIDSTSIDFDNNSIFLDGVNVDQEIRQNDINLNVSHIAIIKEVRDYMVRLQQEIAKEKSVIMDGRDIGTVVLPNATFKIYITADVEERARRRLLEFKEKGLDFSLDQMIEDIERRDLIDSTREVSPLRMAYGAYLLDNTHKSKEACIEEIVDLVKGVVS